MPCSFQQMQGASGLCQPWCSGALLQQGLSAWLCPLPSTDTQPFLLPPHQAVVKLCQQSPTVANVSIVPTIWMVCILSRLPWVIPSHAHLPPMQLIPDVAQKTDVRLQNSAAHAKAILHS